MIFLYQGGSRKDDKRRDEIQLNLTGIRSAEEATEDNASSLSAK
jgi:hypothetical protein